MCRHLQLTSQRHVSTSRNDSTCACALYPVHHRKRTRAHTGQARLSCSVMRASRLRLGCAFLSWTPSQAFVSFPRAAPRPSSVLPQQRVSGFTVPTAKRSTLDTSARVQWRSRTRHGWQPRLSMSSNPGMGGGMNPESFTERAWEAMVRLPSLADANKAQVGTASCG